MRPTSHVRKVKYKKANIIATVAPGIVLAEAIRTAIGINGKILTQNIGLIAVAITLGLDDTAVQTAISEIKGTDQAKQVDNAVAYLARVGIGITPIGRAWGIIFNAGYAIGAPKILDREQAKIFGDSATTSIIGTDGFVTLISAAALTAIDLNSDGTNRKTAAELIMEQFGSVGSVETNAFSAIASLAIKDKLTPQSITRTFETLLRQNADIGNLPEDIVASLGKVGGFSGKNVPPAVA